MKSKHYSAWVLLYVMGLGGCAVDTSHPENEDPVPIHAQGQVYLLDQCPGDEYIQATTQGTPAAASEELAAFPAAIIAAILPTLVQKSVKSLGAAMTKAASEQQVNGFHAGEHLYVLAKQPAARDGKREYLLKLGCVVVQGESATNPVGVLHEIYKEYRSLTERHDDADPDNSPDKCEQIQNYERADHEAYWCRNPDELVDELEGRKPIRAPSFLAVLDVEQSRQRSEMRLIPRFVHFAQSLRKPGDKNKRTVSITLDLQIPGAENPFGSTRIDFKDIRPGESYHQSDLPGIQSHWIALPNAGDSSTEAKNAFNAALDQVLTQAISARTAAETWLEFDENPMPGYNNSATADVMEICSSGENLQRIRLSDAHAKLAAAEARATKGKKTADDIRKLTLRVTYFDACLKAREAYSIVRNFESEVFSKLYPARTYDARVAIFEFKERRALKFLGELLSDDSVATGISTAVVNEVDPVKQQEKAAAAAASQLELMKQYETAQVEARKAIVKYDAAEEGPAKDEAEIDMMALKRAVNRLANQLGLSLPYPAAGTWI